MKRKNSYWPSQDVHFEWEDFDEMETGPTGHGDDCLSDADNGL